MKQDKHHDKEEKRETFTSYRSKGRSFGASYPNTYDQQGRFVEEVRKRGEVAMIRAKRRKGKNGGEEALGSSKPDPKKC